MTAKEVIARLDDGLAFRLTLWGEARGEPVWGRIAVGCVIRNRVVDGRWGTSYRAVCLARKQFSCWNIGTDANHKKVIAIAEALLNGGAPPWSPIEEAIYYETAYVVEGIIAGQLRDCVSRATHYYAPDAMIPRNSVPVWAQGKTPILRLGRHRFFTNIR